MTGDNHKSIWKKTVVVKKIRKTNRASTDTAIVDRRPKSYSLTSDNCQKKWATCSERSIAGGFTRKKETEERDGRWKRGKIGTGENESREIATESSWSRVVCTRGSGSIPTLIAVPSSNDSEQRLQAYRLVWCKSRERVEPRGCLLHCRLRWFKVRRAAFSEVDGNWLRSFEEESRVRFVYGRKGSPLGRGDYSYYCNKDTRFVCSRTTRRKRGPSFFSWPATLHLQEECRDSFGRLAGIQPSPTCNKMFTLAKRSSARFHCHLTCDRISSSFFFNYLLFLHLPVPV